MSTSVDNKVVSMKFDNKQFESGVSTSLGTLGKLKSGLNLEGAAKGLVGISAAAKNMSFAGMASGVEAVQLKFGALQVVALTALTNIANSAVNAGKRLVSSLTIDPVKQGFTEYELKMNAIQTIMAGTGEKLGTVNKYLADLNTYSDKTIYSFSDMTNNIGKFTNAGVKLKDATASIMGISNVAALSGASAEEASRAMYNFGQSLSQGSVKLMDWKSIENANMATVGFKTELMNSAVAAGTLTKGVGGMYKTLKGTPISATKGFNESLEEQWMTSKALTATLGRYADSTTAIGKKAFAAAQSVKTFTQLIGTMQESVGSGWATTWEHIGGNKDQSTKLFTGLSASFNSLVGPSIDARNAMLKFWNLNGGRDAIITTLSNSFKLLGSILKPIGQAFREVFPAMTGKRLTEISKGLAELTSHFKLSSNTIGNLKSTFKGLFAILDIGKQLFVAVASGIFSMMGGVGDLGGGILSVTGSIGDWLVSLDNMIKKSGIFTKVIQAIVSVLTGIGGVGSKVFDTLNENIRAFISGLLQNFSFPGFEDFSNFLEGLGKRLSNVGKEFGNMGGKVGPVGLIFGIMGKTLNIFWDLIVKVASGIGGAIKTMAEIISHAFNTANFSGLMDLIGGLSLGGIAIAISKFLKSVVKPLEGLKGMIGGITGILDGVKGSFEAYQKDLKAGTLLKIAVAIALLTASILTISLIDSGKLASSLGAMGVLFGELLGAMAVFNMIGASSIKSMLSSSVMITMSIAILILATAMKKLGDLNWNQIAKGTVGIAALAAVLVASSKLLSSSSGKMLKGSAGMIMFAYAIQILADACADLAKLSWKELAKGLVGISVLLGAISVFLNSTKFSSKAIVTAIGIAILGEAMKVLASACKDFGSMKWSEISKGLVAIGLLLAEMAAFTKLTGNAKNVISTAVSLVIIAAAMKILASALKDFGGMSWGEIAKGLTVMGLALAEIAIALKVMPSNMLVTGAGLVVVALALNLLASALIKMGSMTWKEIGRGLTVMGGALVILAAGLYAMNNTLAGSAALLIAASAIAILTPALVILGGMSWASIIKSLATLAGIFVVLGLAALVLTPIIPAIIGLSGALILLSVGIIGIGVGLLAVGLGLTALATGFGALAAITATGATAIVAALSIIVIGVASLIPAIMVKIGQGIVAFCGALVAGVPAICTAVMVIVKAIVVALIALTPLILNGVFTLLSSVLDSLIKWGPKLLVQVITLLMSLLQVFNTYLPRIVVMGVTIIVSLINGIASQVNRLIQAGINLIISFINGLATGINNNAPRLIAAMSRLMNSVINAGKLALSAALGGFLAAGGRLISNVINGISAKRSSAVAAVAGVVSGAKSAIGNFVSGFYNAGANVISGFVNGINSKVRSAASAAANLAKSALSSAKHFLGIKSPSREFGKLGKFSGAGFVVGLTSMASKVAEAGKAVGSGAINSMSNAISGISDVVNNNIDAQPVIRPVIDLTNIQNGAKQLYSMMDGVNGYAVGGSIDVANGTARSIQTNQANAFDAQTAKNTAVGNSTNSVSNVFNIKGSNPKEIAAEVSNVLQKQVERRESVWA